MIEPRVFNNPHAVVEGWYWVLPARQLRRGRPRAVTLMGRDLVLFRGADGAVVALDAYCPHMGAHLAEGRVEGNTLRCQFHGWRYDGRGRCVEAPSLGGCPAFPVATRSWPVAERYGLVWLWTGETPGAAIPAVPELGLDGCDSALGARFVKRCHPHVVLINAIDAHHFNTVHRLPVRLAMEATVVDAHTIRFRNTEPIPPTSRLTRVLRRFYRGPLTYAMSYAHASTGTVTLGPDFAHFHLIFALRPTADGRTEGQTILVTRRRPGLRGAVVSAGALFLTRLVARYFARGDSRIFRSIRFRLQTPIGADRATLAFVRHTERQPTVAWRSAPEREERETRADLGVCRSTEERPEDRDRFRAAVRAAASPPQSTGGASEGSSETPPKRLEARHGG